MDDPLSFESFSLLRYQLMRIFSVGRILNNVTTTVLWQEQNHISDFESISGKLDKGLSCVALWLAAVLGKHSVRI